ncbi:MAG: nickel-dependent hydrogenase large subunit [Desulfobacterales bacterium]|jgi:hydrogenase large subunit
MVKQKIKVYPLNRVEGDLEIQIEFEGNAVSEAYSAGTMYRGFENLMLGRAPLDGLVITPRICGICSTSHLKAAAQALDQFFDVRVPDNAKRVRNITLMVEHLQNDVRHAFVMFAADFTNPVHAGHPLYGEGVRRYAPLKGDTTLQAIQETQKIIAIIAILGGQWPHSSFMVPGGVVCMPSANDVTQCLFLLKNFRKWFESRVLGCSLERWREVTSKADLYAWLDEAASHAASDLGFYIRFAASAGLAKLGKGHGNFISGGGLDLPEATSVKSLGDNGQLLPSGFVRNLDPEQFDQTKVTEEVAHSWFDDYKGGRHPFNGVTKPNTKDHESGKYSWAKAPRYDGLPAETGPLAEMVVACHPLFVDLIQQDGPSVFTRQLARLVRPALLIPVLEQWLRETAACKENFYRDYGKKQNGEGFGLVEAPRGFLGHWIKIQNSKIERYQIITPSAWNASPRDSKGVRGPWEEALIGTEVKNRENPVEIDHVIRSFDPCLVCTVHAVDKTRPVSDIFEKKPTVSSDESI